MNEETSFFKILGRACSYALTTAFALFAGYLFSSQITNNAILLGIPFSFSIGFFVKYSYCFHYNENNKFIIESKLLEILKICFWFISIPMTIIVILFYILLSNQVPSIYIIFSLTFFAWSFSKYGSFLLKMNKSISTSEITVRHRVVWPTILTIAFSLYYGIFFEILNNGFFIYFYFPIGLICGLFFYTEVNDKAPKDFVKSNFLFWTSAIVILLILNQNIFPVQQNLKSVFSALLICISVAIFLGLLESWRITAYIRKRSSSQDLNLKNTTPIFHSWEKYYFSTLALLMLIICCVPFVYIMSPFGTYFFSLFVIHAIISLIVWGKLGRKSTIKKFLIFNTGKVDLQNYWAFTKSLMGFVFLIIFVLATAYSSEPESETLPFTFYQFAMPIVTLLVVLQGKKLKQEHDYYNKQYKDMSIWIWLFFNKYINLLRIASLITYIFCVCIILMKILYPDTIKSYKADHAFILYIIMIIYSNLFELYYYIRKKNGGTKLYKIITRVIGALQTTRISTSIVITSIILLPTLRGLNFTYFELLLAINVLLTSMGGFALNDFYDSEKDKINKPYRPIPSNKLTKTSTFYIAVSLLLTSFIVACYNTVIHPFGYVQLILLFALIFYNYVTKNLAIIKTVYTALISSMVIAYPLFVHFFDYKFLLLPFATFFFILGREIFMDVLDLKGDKSSGIYTLPIIIGTKKSIVFAFLSLLLGVSIIVPLFISNMYLIDILLLVTLVLSLIIFFVLWMFGSLKLKRISIIYLWIPMFIGLTKLFI